MHDLFYSKVIVLVDRISLIFLGYKMFLMFATVNIGAMAVFSLYVLIHLHLCLSHSLTSCSSLVPETKGRSLEEMDVIFGSVTAEQRQKHIEQEERGQLHASTFVLLMLIISDIISLHSPRSRTQRHNIGQVSRE